MFPVWNFNSWARFIPGFLSIFLIYILNQLIELINWISNPLPPIQINRVERILLIFFGYGFDIFRTLTIILRQVWIHPFLWTKTNIFYGPKSAIWAYFWAQFCIFCQSNDDTLTKHKKHSWHSCGVLKKHNDKIKFPMHWYFLQELFRINEKKSFLLPGSMSFCFIYLSISTLIKRIKHFF